MKRNSSSAFFGLVGLLFILLTVGFLYSPQTVAVIPAGAQGTGAPLTGFAWSSNIGWIKVSGSGYGLALGDEAAGKRFITGFAWNNNIGWINFNPGGNYPASGNTVPSDAYLDVNNQRVFGWARACSVFATGCSGALKSNSQLGGWDGWISLGQSPIGPVPKYGIQTQTQVVGNQTNIKFSGFAWGERVVGWLNMAPLVGFEVVCNNCVPADQALTVQITGNRSGSVSSAPAGINGCSSGSCEASFPQNTNVTLTATYGANIGVTWAGCNSTNGDTCNVTMDQAKTVTAAFNCTSGCGGGNSNDILIVGVTNTDGGNGSVNSSDNNISGCTASGGTCTHDYGASGPNGLVLTANPAAGSTVSWGGVCSGASGNTCTLNVSNTTRAEVTFDGDGSNGSGNCSDGIQNGDETGVDTGGRCGNGGGPDCTTDPTLPQCIDCSLPGNAGLSQCQVCDPLVTINCKIDCIKPIAISGLTSGRIVVNDQTRQP